MSFKAIQQAFIDYIKDPQSPLPKGTDERHMKVYRELFFNNIEGFVSAAFPVLRSLYTESYWLNLIQVFFVKHDCRSPIFVDIAAEFLGFLNDEYQLTEDDPEFMLELAHYEYLELLVSVAQDDPNTQKQVTLHNALPLCISNSAKIAQYRFEVQKISKDYQPEAPASEPQYFCVYRDMSDEVKFILLTSLSAQVLAYLSENPGLSKTQLIAAIAQLFPALAVTDIQTGISHLLEQMLARGIVSAICINNLSQK